MEPGKLATRLAMVYEGTIQNGVVVFSAGVPWPEGTHVRVEPTLSPPEKRVDVEKIDPVFQMADLAGDAGIPDLSVNVDHYLYGHPKVIDGQ